MREIKIANALLNLWWTKLIRPAVHWTSSNFARSCFPLPVNCRSVVDTDSRQQRASVSEFLPSYRLRESSRMFATMDMRV